MTEPAESPDRLTVLTSRPLTTMTGGQGTYHHPVLANPVAALS